MRLAALTLPLLLLACADPVTSTRVQDGKPRLLVKGAPAAAVLYLDGRPVGDASAYAGEPGILSLEPGTHVVEVRVGTRVLVSEKAFFGGGELRTVTVPPGGAP